MEDLQRISVKVRSTMQHGFAVSVDRFNSNTRGYLVERKRHVERKEHVACSKLTRYYAFVGNSKVQNRTECA